DDICLWAQLFSDWLDVCAVRRGTHDEDDVFIFTRIHELNRQIEENLDFSQRIKRELQNFCPAVNIRQRRCTEKKLPEIARWAVVGGEEKKACLLRYRYEWLGPLRASVDAIADFGCWAKTESETCFEPYALLWTLNATSVTVIDKNPEYIRNAREWLRITRERNAYFNDCNLEFVVGDMTGGIDALDDSDFDLSYCQAVLYNMQHSWEELQSSIYEMARVVRPGGWVIAIETIRDKNGGSVDIGRLFEM
ncbi:unnamed protein product, partial [marine sediment metagenome]